MKIVLGYDHYYGRRIFGIWWGTNPNARIGDHRSKHGRVWTLWPPILIAKW